MDHGIVGALLLFDALMELANNSSYAGIYSEIKDYQEFYTRICDAIARHNMWRATPDREDIYRSFNLWELIPNADMRHKIYYRDNTLEPVNILTVANVEVYFILTQLFESR